MLWSSPSRGRASGRSVERPISVDARRELLRIVGGDALALYARRNYLPIEEIVLNTICYEVAGLIEVSLGARQIPSGSVTVRLPKHPRANFHSVPFDSETGLFVEAAWKQFLLLEHSPDDAPSGDPRPDLPHVLVGTLEEMQVASAALPVEKAYHDFWHDPELISQL